MKLSLTITETRSKFNQFGREESIGEQTRAEVADLTGSASVVAGFLRTLADELDPKPEPPAMWESVEGCPCGCGPR